MEKKIGKIKSIRFGFGGYQDAQFGMTVDLGSEKECWGVGSFRGYWATKPDSYCKWTEQDQINYLGEMCMGIAELLSAAKKTSIDQLQGVPVEVTFDKNMLQSWRILTEVI